MCRNSQGFLINKKNMIYWQELPPVRNIIFEGGGAKAIVYPGAIAAFEENNLLSRLERVAGSSAGAFTATLLAFGLHSQELRNIINTINLTELLDPFHATGKKLSYLTRMICGGKNLTGTMLLGTQARYAFHGNDLLNKLREIVANMVKLRAEECPEVYNIISRERLENPDTAGITFNDLHRLKEVLSDIRELIITGTNVTDHRLDFFCQRFTPDMEIAMANRISMSLPFLFAPVVYEGKVMIDGGVLCNLPLQMFSHAPIAGPSDALYVYMEQNTSALGFSVTTDYSRLIPYSGAFNEHSTFDKLLDRYLLSNLGYLAADDLVRKMKYNSGHFIVSLNPIGQKTTDFEVSNARKDELFQQGYEDATRYIQNFRQQGGFHFRSQNIYDLMQQFYPAHTAKLCDDLLNNRLDFEFEMKIDDETQVIDDIKSIVERYYLAVTLCNAKLDDYDKMAGVNDLGNGMRLLEGHGLELKRICPTEVLEKKHGVAQTIHLEFENTKYDSFKLFHKIRGIDESNIEREMKIRDKISESTSLILFYCEQYQRKLNSRFKFLSIKKRSELLEIFMSHLKTLQKNSFNYSVREIINQIEHYSKRFSIERVNIERQHPFLFFQNAILRESRRFMKNLNEIMRDLNETINPQIQTGSDVEANDEKYDASDPALMRTVVGK